MKLRSCFSQNRKLVGVEVVGTGFVLQKMLSNGRITVNFCWSPIAISLWLEFLLLVSGSNTFRDMLIDSILQSLGCTAHVATIAATNAAAIVATWAVQPKDCRIESINISLKVLEPDTNNRNSNHNEIAIGLQQKLTVIRPLDNIFCKTKPVPTTSTPTSFLFWLKQERNFTYLHWKQHSFGF